MTVLNIRMPVTGLYVCSTENNPDDQEWLDQLKDRAESRKYYRVPNSVQDWGPTVLRDHVDSMRHASEKLLGHDALTFAIRLGGDEFMILDDETYRDLSE